MNANLRAYERKVKHLIKLCAIIILHANEFFATVTR